MIIGLGHQAQVGKDTAAAILVEKYGFERLAFADLLKKVAYDINPRIGFLTLQTLVDDGGWELAKQDPAVRQFLQRLGVAARENLGVDVWVKPIFDQMIRGGRYVITDVRFPNEFDALMDSGAWLVKLTRKSAPSAGNHPSETSLAESDWDLVIENDGTVEELEDRLREIPHVASLLGVASPA